MYPFHTLIAKVIGDILQKPDNKFALVTFFWSIFVVGKKRTDGSWEDEAISICDIIRCVSIPLFHQNPTEWILIFASCSMFSFILQKKPFFGVLLFSTLQVVLYFLLIGFSPMTYWNFGKQFFNLVVWPDDPRQLALEMGMHLAVAIAALHVLVKIISRVLELVEINYFYACLVFQPAVTISMFPGQWTLWALSIWFSALLLFIRIKRDNCAIIRGLGVTFLYYYIKTLTVR